MRFAHLTAAEIRTLDRDATLVVAPIAACEQHSDHLPVFTDSLLCGAVADGVEARLPEHVLLLPVFWLGASDHHLPFGGTLSASLPTYETLLVELLRPLLNDGFARILLLNGHGGNIDPSRVALRRLDVEYPRALLTGAAYWELASAELAALCRGGRTSVGHACEIETAMMLALHPEMVRADLIRDDPCPSPQGLEGLFWARDFQRRTDHGAVGYPQAASAEAGRLMLEAVIARVTDVARTLLALPLEEA
jgi:creatinine amidohydrolase